MKQNHNRPIRKNETRRDTCWRIPQEGPLTPRLKETRKPDCIGFVSSFPTDEEGE